jgi:hypothetical protein
MSAFKRRATHFGLHAHSARPLSLLLQKSDQGRNNGAAAMLGYVRNKLLPEIQLITG